MKPTLPLLRRSEIAFLIGVSLISIGLTSWFTANRLLQKQHVAAEVFLGQRMRQSDTAKGLENSPLLLKQVFLAAGYHEGVEFSILACALGLIAGAIGLYIRDQENVSTNCKRDAGQNEP
jgi:hypothetical protein